MATQLEPLSTFLSTLPSSEHAELVARVEASLNARAVAATAPLDAAQQARIASLESTLAALNEQLQQRREAVPTQAAQKLEEEQKAAIAATMSSADAAAATAAATAAAAANSETRMMLAGNLEQCTAVSAMCNEQATTEVQRALAAANDMAAQIGATLGAIGGCVPTATDLAIAPPNGENQGVNQVDAAAEMLRRRRAAQQDVKMLSTMAAGSLLKM